MIVNILYSTILSCFNNNIELLVLHKTDICKIILFLTKKTIIYLECFYIIIIIRISRSLLCIPTFINKLHYICVKSYKRTET